MCSKSMMGIALLVAGGASTCCAFARRTVSARRPSDCGLLCDGSAHVRLRLTDPGWLILRACVIGLYGLYGLYT